MVIKNENEIIPYYIIQNNLIIGPEEIKYNLGSLSLNDSDFQFVYFASLDNNIKFKIIQMEDGVNIIKRNKLHLLKVKIKEKRKEDLEQFETRAIIKLEYNGVSKIVKYSINYQLEAMKIFLRCDKYKLKYIGKSTYLLNSSILYSGETIFFFIKNLFYDSERGENIFKVNLTTFDDNTCIKPIKIQNREGFSLKIRSESTNDILSCLATIFVCPRYKFNIKFNCQVKLFDFDFLIALNDKKGFLSKKIFCPFEKQDEFEFILYVGVSQKRICQLNLEKVYDDNFIKINEDIRETKFLKSIKINIHVKLLKKN